MRKGIADDGDEAKMLNTSYWVSLSLDAMTGNDEHQAERNANNDDGGGESFRLRI